MNERCSRRIDEKSISTNALSLKLSISSGNSRKRSFFCSIICTVLHFLHSTLVFSSLRIYNLEFKSWYPQRICRFCSRIGDNIKYRWMNKSSSFEMTVPSKRQLRQNANDESAKRGFDSPKEDWCSFTGQVTGLSYSFSRQIALLLRNDVSFCPSTYILPFQLRLSTLLLIFRTNIVCIRNRKLKNICIVLRAARAGHAWRAAVSTLRYTTEHDRSQKFLSPLRSFVRSSAFAPELFSFQFALAFLPIDGTLVRPVRIVHIRGRARVHIPRTRSIPIVARNMLNDNAVISQSHFVSSNSLFSLESDGRVSIFVCYVHLPTLIYLPTFSITSASGSPAILPNFRSLFPSSPFVRQPRDASLESSCATWNVATTLLLRRVEVDLLLSARTRRNVLVQRQTGETNIL